MVDGSGADTFIDGVACRVPDEEAIATIVHLRPLGVGPAVMHRADGFTLRAGGLVTTPGRTVRRQRAHSPAVMRRYLDRAAGRRVAVVLSAAGDLDAPSSPQIRPANPASLSAVTCSLPVSGAPVSRLRPWSPRQRAGEDDR